MNTKYLNLKFIQGSKTLNIDNNKYKITNIEGIEYPELDVSTTSNAHYDGSYIDSSRVDKRTINITIDYMFNDVEIERKNLISFFNPKTRGTLIIDYCDNKKATEYVINNFKSKIDNVYNILTFELDLICTDPYLHDIEEAKQEIALWRGAFHFPLVSNVNKKIIMGVKEPSLIANVVNNGDVPIGLIIDFIANGTVKNPSFFNINTREYIRVNVTMNAGEVIRIDTRTGNKKIIRKVNETETNIMNLLDLQSTFLKANVGDNLFRYNAEEGFNFMDVTVYYNPAYLGV